MKKIFLATAFIIVSVIGANAQKGQQGFQFGAGLRLGLPVGDFSNGYSFGVGAEVQGEGHFSEMISGVITSGYSSFFGKSGISSVGFIPILAGVRVYPSTNFFIGAQAGYGIFTGSGNSSGGFDYQPQVGYNASNFQLALNYNGWSKNGGTLGHIGLTGIYKFGGGK